jgi:hypothetical protein
MSEMKKRMDALKKASSGPADAAADAKKTGDVAPAPTVPQNARIVEATMEKAVVKAEKPKKKVECQFCGSEFSEASIKKHERSCKDNPENDAPVVDAYTKAEVDDLVKKAVNDAIVNNVEDQMASVYKKLAPIDEVAAIKAEIESMKASMSVSSLQANETSVENAVLRSDVASMVDAWEALKAPVLKRWKACPGYKKLIEVFDAKIGRISSGLLK